MQSEDIKTKDVETEDIKIDDTSEIEIPEETQRVEQSVESVGVGVGVPAPAVEQAQEGTPVVELPVEEVATETEHESEEDLPMAPKPSTPERIEPVKESSSQTQKAEREPIAPVVQSSEPQPQSTPEQPQIKERIVYKKDPRNVANTPEGTANFIQKLLIKARVRIQERKRKKLDKIMGLFDTKSQITNKDARGLFRVTKRTIRRYFDQLEREQKIIQVGGVGRGVIYIRKL